MATKKTAEIPAIKYTGKATEETIANWKKEHGADRVFAIEMPTGDNEVSVCYFRKPNRIHIANAMSHVMREQVIEAGESVLDATWLGGDERCKSLEDKYTDYRVGTAWRLYESVKVFDAIIKNV